MSFGRIVVYRDVTTLGPLANGALSDADELGCLSHEDVVRPIGRGQILVEIIRQFNDPTDQSLWGGDMGGCLEEPLLRGVRGLVSAFTGRGHKVRRGACLRLVARHEENESGDISTSNLRDCQRTRGQLPNCVRTLEDRSDMKRRARTKTAPQDQSEVAEGAISGTVPRGRVNSSQRGN